jgi:hypothetical protein
METKYEQYIAEIILDLFGLQKRILGICERRGRGRISRHNLSFKYFSISMSSILLVIKKKCLIYGQAMRGRERSHISTP